MACTLLQELCLKSNADTDMRSHLARVAAQRLLSGGSDVAKLIFAAPAVQPGAAADQTTRASVSPAALPVMQQLVQLVPNSGQRCAALAALPIASLVATQPSDLGFVADAGLQQPRLAQCAHAVALVLHGQARSTSSTAGAAQPSEANDSATVPDERAPHGDGIPGIPVKKTLLRVSVKRLAAFTLQDPARERLRRLQHIDVRNQALGDAAESTAALSMQLVQLAVGLTHLNLHGNPLHGDELMFQPHDLPSLAHLDISSCRGFGWRGAVSLQHLQALTYLNLADTDLQPHGMHASAQPAVKTAIWQLQHLRLLNLRKTQLAPHDREALQAAAETTRPRPDSLAAVQTRVIISM